MHIACNDVIEYKTYCHCVSTWCCGLVEGTYDPAPMISVLSVRVTSPLVFDNSTSNHMALADFCQVFLSLPFTPDNSSRQC